MMFSQCKLLLNECLGSGRLAAGQFVQASSGCEASRLCPPRRARFAHLARLFPARQPLVCLVEGSHRLRLEPFNT